MVQEDDAAAAVWGVDEDSLLRKGTRELLGEALKVVADEEEAIVKAAARISSRVLNITAREMEVDWYRSIEGPLKVDAEEVTREFDFDGSKEDTTVPPLRDQNVILEVHFDNVNFPDTEADLAVEEDIPTEEILELVEATKDWAHLKKLLSEEKLGELNELLSEAGLGEGDFAKFVENPPEAAHLALVRFMATNLPGYETVDAITSLRGFEMEKQHPYCRILLSYPYVQERFQTACTMICFPSQAEEIMDVLQRYTDIAREITESKKLAYVLRAALVLFNKVLKRDGETPAEGFNLDILPKLKEEKNPQDESKTLLMTLVKGIVSSSPDYLPIDDMPVLGHEMMYMPGLDELDDAITDLYCSLESALEFCELVNKKDPFVYDACRQFNSRGEDAPKTTRSKLVCMHGVLRVSLQKMMSFFGEENINSRSRQMHIIKIIWEFTRDLDSAVIRAKIGSLTAKLASVA
mmetsp:Transcript_5652/g.16805  ORF Transcript_5652/g.16805 Transcript_5652/m.16805 type:complete len:465 (-) Transcript_5652:253-1647(-)|eukprot:CAMPEP_0198736160 /NCGR_PEP_ID=MMETSP1475-20131203/63894_1 /TAXON_ID= ORGANISM="Unidentified sp., Strain CCMP1999" /NCGR_SAMPLE_ID=MMETSP1475 /ASSEMBLY_ACC=CAM_ASM_001111 /LENGTH=464 /DNA_ID=CAMNT_0044499927 /DNA_START=36 /DNA_END=1430 /DNA_ORIENTATION=+